MGVRPRLQLQTTAPAFILLVDQMGWSVSRWLTRTIRRVQIQLQVSKIYLVSYLSVINVSVWEAGLRPAPARPLPSLPRSRLRSHMTEHSYISKILGRGELGYNSAEQEDIGEGWRLMGCDTDTVQIPISSSSFQPSVAVRDTNRCSTKW